MSSEFSLKQFFFFFKSYSQGVSCFHMPFLFKWMWTLPVKGLQTCVGRWLDVSIGLVPWFQIGCIQARNNSFLWYKKKLIPESQSHCRWNVVCVPNHSVTCATLCDPMDCSLPGSSVHGIFQARILEWAAISSSSRSSRSRDQTCISYILYIGRRILYQ